MIWRLLLDGAARGAWNMAVDEALLMAATQPETVPVLRFYDWDPACLSLGRFQSFDQTVAASAALRGVLERGGTDFDWVRRPTGGRAVWHAHEITYSVVMREELLPPDSRSVAGAYRWFSEGFITGLEALGIRAQLAPGESREQRDRALRTANCFASATRCDFLVQGRKLIGAAQCRRHGAILQHGSILLHIDSESWQNAVGGDEPKGAVAENGGEQDTGADGMAALHDLGITASRSEIVQFLCDGITHELGATLEQSSLVDAEREMAKELHSRKYMRDEWNINGREKA